MGWLGGVARDLDPVSQGPSSCDIYHDEEEIEED